MSLMPIASLSPVSPNGSGAGFCLRNRSSAAALTRRTQGEGRPRALRARRRPRGALRQNNHVNKGNRQQVFEGSPAAPDSYRYGENEPPGLCVISAPRLKVPAQRSPEDGVAPAVVHHDRGLLEVRHPSL